mmetsp:Transcript_55768/g.146112  ORF Transcript_55768/g.146112 Transcript_55768/m.146112 type:complete len:731 (-) Transcript_55768:272-2464(-)
MYGRVFRGEPSRAGDEENDRSRQPQQEEEVEEANSEKADSSVRGSVAGSSRVSSHLTDSKHSALTAGTLGKLSAFTAPPRYRNSGAFVHGTKFKHFLSIMQHGLKAGGADIFMIDEVRADGRVPGLQTRPEILIFIDENKARSENMEFEYDASQGIWKTKGIKGVIRPWFFQKVVDQRKGPGRGNVLFQSKEDPIMQANTIKGAHRPRYLMHATYWANVTGIMQEGILPAKNPTSFLRQPLKELLQGAESHVYTVSYPSSTGGAVAERAPVAEHFQVMFPSRVGDLERTPSADDDPEVPKQVPEVGHPWRVASEAVGLDRPPDAFFVIDLKKAEELNIPLNLVQSGDREDTVYIEGPVPWEVLVRAEPNEPVNLPESLRANIVDARSFDDIPIIDLRKDETTLVEQMRYACEVVGFMQIVGHGVPVELQERHMRLQKRFFELPQEVKDRIKLNDDCPVRGYFGRGGEDLDNVLLEQVDSAKGEKIALQTRKDNKEALDTNGVPWSKPKGGFVSEIFGMPSRLPEEEELPGFRTTLEEYSKAMFDLSKRLLQLMALVLGKPREFFEQYLTAPVATHRLLHYWPIKDFNTQIGVGEHTDYGLLTLLKQDFVGGLQVLNYKDRKWIHAVPIQDAFVVNLGDMMGRWTAHRFKSTVHRVINTSLNERYSVPYFLEPNMDAVIKFGELCAGDADKKDEIHKNQDQSGTAEEILERFYRASGQLKVRGLAAKDGKA